MPGVPVGPQLVVDLFQGLPHPVLGGLDRVDLLHERVLGVVVNEVDPLPALPVVDALRGDPHRALGLGQGALQVLAGLHQVVGLVHVTLELGLVCNGISGKSCLDVHKHFLPNL